MPRRRPVHLPRTPRVDDFLLDLAASFAERDRAVLMATSKVARIVRRECRAARARNPKADVYARITAGDLAPDGGLFAAGRVQREVE